ncbi:sterol desaturase family protein [Alterinioella nitratireducens]|uniref:sterol desaturase family protein n=1 Tax=Alterinioella nitratireducens TaxID=2735915 RepID=UPI0015556855|nr:sterol desaturase family protein [Alterinioella nitratireducens]NPD19652.1 sterol desaturase family protein [Alterinioella nitratireducens]
MSDTRQEWNHVPEVPIRVSPLWSWPPQPVAALRWYLDSWFFLTINMAIVAISFASLYLASPTLEQTAQPAPGWIALIFLRNAVIVTLVAGLLHLWFHSYARQGTALKYDPRPYPRRGRVFTFDRQLADNAFWTLASGVTVWSAFECLMWWAMANGYAATITFLTNPIWFIAIFFLIPVWESFYFYWMHRFLHLGPMYRFHALHHRNTDIGPWSGLSMHPVEHLFYFGSVLIHFAIASHPVHVIFHLMFYGLLAITTHTGFEGVLFRNRKRLHLGNFHHQIHHRYFECNYGNLDVPWDRFFGSWHDGTPEAKARMRERLAARRR